MNGEGRHPAKNGDPQGSISQSQVYPDLGPRLEALVASTERDDCQMMVYGHVLSATDDAVEFRVDGLLDDAFCLANLEASMWKRIPLVVWIPHDRIHWMRQARRNGGAA